MHIFIAQTAPVVYLNGCLLFVGGLAVVQSHNRWSWSWPLLVTVSGWSVLGIGLIRMIAPTVAQIDEGPVTSAIFVALVVLGGLLSLLGFGLLGAAPEKD